MAQAVSLWTPIKIRLAILATFAPPSTNTLGGDIRGTGFSLWWPHTKSHSRYWQRSLVHRPTHSAKTFVAQASACGLPTKIPLAILATFALRSPQIWAGHEDACAWSGSELWISLRRSSSADSLRGRLSYLRFEGGLRRSDCDSFCGGGGGAGGGSCQPTTVAVLRVV